MGYSAGSDLHKYMHFQAVMCTRRWAKVFNAEYRIVQCVRQDRGIVLNFLWASSLPVVSLPAQTFQHHPLRAGTEEWR